MLQGQKIILAVGCILKEDLQVTLGWIRQVDLFTTFMFLKKIMNTLYLF